MRRGANVWVVDYTPSALRLIAKQPGGDRLLRVCGDAFQLPFADGSFDVVFHQGLLEHFREPQRLLAENARVLKRGGLLLVDVPQRWHYYTPLKHLMIAFTTLVRRLGDRVHDRQLRGMLRDVRLVPVPAVVRAESLLSRRAQRRSGAGRDLRCSRRCRSSGRRWRACNGSRRQRCYTRG